jgi:hypothetical protein
MRSNAYPQLCLTLDSGNYPVLDRCRNALFWSSSYVRGEDDAFTLTTSRSNQILYLGTDGNGLLRAIESGSSIKYLWTFSITSQEVNILVGVRIRFLLCCGFLTGYDF